MPSHAGSGFLILVVALLAGCGQGGPRESAGVPSLAGADPSMVGEQSLPDWHPPVSPSSPRLPDGHPVLPEGHPLLQGQGKAGCPGRAQREGWGRGTAPVTAAAPEIVST
jgi:predicted small lipoprotein YifL